MLLTERKDKIKKLCRVEWFCFLYHRWSLFFCYFSLVRDQVHGYLRHPEMKLYFRLNIFCINWASLGSVALYVEDVGAAIGAEDLQGGDNAEGAGADLGHHVGQDHGVLLGVASGDETDVVTADILEDEFY